MRYPCRVNAELNGDVCDVDASDFGRGEKGQKRSGQKCESHNRRVPDVQAAGDALGTESREYELAAKRVAIFGDGGSHTSFQEAWIHA